MDTSTLVTPSPRNTSSHLDRQSLHPTPVDTVPHATYRQPQKKIPEYPRSIIRLHSRLQHGRGGWIFKIFKYGVYMATLCLRDRNLTKQTARFATTTCTILICF